VLRIGKTSRRIVPWLERGGYEVRYREFDGGHVVPPAVAWEAATWLANRG
jgi:phospholipase/carboxylesterase